MDVRPTGPAGGRENGAQRRMLGLSLGPAARALAGVVVLVGVWVLATTEGPAEVLGTALIVAATGALVVFPVPDGVSPVRVNGRRAIAGGLALLLLNVWRTSRHVVVDDQLAPSVWPWLWGFACAACLVVVIQPGRLDAWVASGCALGAVCTGRMAATVANADGGLYSAERAAYGVALYVVMVWLLACLWWVASPRRDRPPGR